MICSFSQQNVKSVTLLMTIVFILVVWINKFANLKQDNQNLYERFVYNSIKINPGKHRLTFQIGDITKKSVSSVALLGITIDSKLNFKKHINNIVKKAYIINCVPEDYENF